MKHLYPQIANCMTSILLEERDCRHFLFVAFCRFVQRLFEVLGLIRKNPFLPPFILRNTLFFPQLHPSSFIDISYKNMSSTHPNSEDNYRNHSGHFMEYRSSELLCQPCPTLEKILQRSPSFWINPKTYPNITAQEAETLIEKIIHDKRMGMGQKQKNCID